MIGGQDRQTPSKSGDRVLRTEAGRDITPRPCPCPCCLPLCAGVANLMFDRVRRRPCADQDERELKYGGRRRLRQALNYTMKSLMLAEFTRTIRTCITNVCLSKLHDEINSGFETSGITQRDRWIRGRREIWEAVSLYVRSSSWDISKLLSSSS